MRQFKLLFALFFLWAVTAPQAIAARTSGFDLVTMKNGDIYNGKVAQKGLTLDTHYGLVSIPLPFITSVVRGNGTTPDRIDTRFGEHFSGTLVEQEITIIRVLDPTLPLHLEEISEIQFASRRSRLKPAIAPDTLESRQGDLFAARIATNDFMLRGKDSLRILKRRDLFLMEIEQMYDDEGVITQITTNDGDELTGDLLTTRIQAQDRYGNQLQIPAGELSSLAFQVNHQRHSRPYFNYRKRITPAKLFQDQLRDGTSGPEMVALRGGTFQRGDLQGDGDSDEKPPVEIHLRPFAIGLYEVTFAEYDRFCESTGREKPDDAGWGRGRRPVVNVSWNDATAYTEWLSRQTGQRYRLPSDAEWEFAARGGSKSRYWWGDELVPGRANCSGCGSLWDGERTSPVGRFLPNPFGLHDTAGNVFEWTFDCWNDTFADAPTNGDPLLKPECGIRVIRGGAWSFPPAEVRPANRWRDFQPRRSDDTGFRVVRELNE